MISGPTSLDTSVVLRLLVGDPMPLYQRANQFLHEQLAAHATVHVSDYVLAEAYFALQSYYEMPNAEALAVLASFVQHSGVTVTPVARQVLDLPGLATTKPGFMERLIHGAAQSAGHTLVTFEKAAKKLPGTFLLPAS